MASAPSSGLVDQEGMARDPRDLHLDEDEGVLREFLGVVRSHDVKGKKLHDANIVATMRAHGVRRLVTLNVAGFERYEDLIQLERLVS